MNKQTIAPYFIFGVSLLSIIAVFSLDPIAQNLEYHHYKDGRTLWGIANFVNVLSNLPFLLVGLWALHGLLISKKIIIIDELKPLYGFFFISVSIVALGSTYYHLSPNNSTLVWDRVPITCAFMALFAIAIAEFVSPKLAKMLFLPLLLLGILAVFYWDYSESIGEGDLRYYALVQVLPLIIMPMLLIFYSSRFSKSNAYWWLFISYAIAKIAEVLDAEIYQVFNAISGHSVKHLVAALGIAILVHSFTRRQLKTR